MDKYKVVYRIEARQSIDARASFIVEQSGSLAMANQYIDMVYAFCDTLSAFPHRNIKRDDLFPGLRITNFKGTTVIAYLVDDNKKIVHIVDIFHSRQNYEMNWD